MENNSKEIIVTLQFPRFKLVPKELCYIISFVPELYLAAKNVDNSKILISKGVRGKSITAEIKGC